MFLEELEGLKDRYPDRFHLIHVLSRESGDDPAVLRAASMPQGSTQLFDTIVDADTVDDWYLCGPFDMVEARAPC